MAENITIFDFVAWLRDQIAPENISALMTEYGYTDDNNETIIMALREDDRFVQSMGELLGRSLKQNDVELNRSIGGMNMQSNSLSAKEWSKIAKSRKIMDHADGESSIDTDSESKKVDWGKVINTVLTIGAGVANSIWGTGTNVQQSQEDKTTGSGSNTALYIIIGVVVVAVVAILWISLSGKK